MIYKLMVIASVFVASCAQILLKCAARRQNTPFWRQYLNAWVVGGYGLLLGSLLVNVFCLKKGVLLKEVSVLESLSLLFVPVLSWFFSRESVTWRKTVAMGLVMVGTVVFFMDSSPRKAKCPWWQWQKQETPSFLEDISLPVLPSDSKTPNRGNSET